MGPDAVASLVSEGMLTLATVGAPLFGAMLLMGLVIGVAQSATQINDPAVGFVPRIAVAVGISWILGGWILHRLAGFFTAAVMRIAESR